MIHLVVSRLAIAASFWELTTGAREGLFPIVAFKVGELETCDTVGVSVAAL